MIPPDKGTPVRRSNNLGMEGPGSMVSNEGGPMKGVTSCLKNLNSKARNIQPYKTLINHNQSQRHPEHEQVMDYFLEKILNILGWLDSSAAVKSPWEYNNMSFGIVAK